MTIALVRSAKSVAGGSPNTCTITAPASGNLLVVQVHSTTDSGTAPTVNNSITQVPGATVLSGSTRRATTFYKVANGTETTSITATQAGVTSLSVQVYEYSSTAGWPATPYDQVTSSTSSGASVATLTALSVVTTAPNEVINIGVALAAYTAPAFTNSFVVEQSDTTNLFSGDLIVTATGTYSTVPSWTTARVSCASMVSFKDNSASGAMYALASDAGPGEEINRLRLVNPVRQTWTGGTNQSDSTIQGSAQNSPKALVVQLLARLRSTRTPLLPQQHLYTGGAVASDSVITGTGLLAQKPLTARQLDLLRHRTMQALLPQQHVFTGGTVASDSTVSATGSVAPVVNLVQRMRNLQPPRDALRRRLTLTTGATVASDTTITGTGQANAKDVVARFMARLRTPDQATPLQGNYFAGATIQSDSTLTGTGTNESGTTAPTQQVGGTWDRVPHRIGDRLPGEQQFDFDFELETLVLMLAVTV